MCGRYNLITDAQAIVDFFDLGNSLEMEPRYNIAPSQSVPAIRIRDNQRILGMFHWGLIPRWAQEKEIGYRMINARAETLAERPTYRTPFRTQRCLIPATGFYEWKQQGTRQPYNIRIGEGKLFAFAGLWEQWVHDDEIIDSCTIITTEANKVVQPVHDRMPVILHPRIYQTWLDPGNQSTDDLAGLLRPCPPNWLNMYPVGNIVGNAKNDCPECIEPAPMV
jgi:putative SOS response-associated peptidase YedK